MRLRGEHEAVKLQCGFQLRQADAKVPPLTLIIASRPYSRPALADAKVPGAYCCVRLTDIACQLSLPASAPVAVPPRQRPYSCPSRACLLASPAAYQDEERWTPARTRL